MRFKKSQIIKSILVFSLSLFLKNKHVKTSRFGTRSYTFHHTHRQDNPTQEDIYLTYTDKTLITIDKTLTHLKIKTLKTSILISILRRTKQNLTWIYQTQYTHTLESILIDNAYRCALN